MTQGQRTRRPEGWINLGDFGQGAEWAWYSSETGETHILTESAIMIYRETMTAGEVAEAIGYRDPHEFYFWISAVPKDAHPFGPGIERDRVRGVLRRAVKAHRPEWAGCEYLDCGCGAMVSGSERACAECGATW